MMNKTLLHTAMAVSLSCVGLAVNAAMPQKSLLKMGPQTETCPYGLGTPATGCLAGAPIPQTNYFAMDNNGSLVHEENERIAIAPGTDLGILLGVVQDQVIAGNDPDQIDLPWSFFGNDGVHQSDGTPITILNNTLAGGNAANEATLAMAGWRVFYNSLNIDMGSGGIINDGFAVVTCGSDCSDGDTYTLVYDAIVPAAVPSFGGIYYGFQISGTIEDQNLAPTVKAVGGTDLLVVNVVPNGSVVIDLSANVEDTDGDGVDNTSFVRVYSDALGRTATFMDDGMGVVTYTDTAGMDTVAPDTFTYTVADTLGKVSASFTVEVNVITGNLPPIASPFAIDANKNTTGTADIAANATDGGDGDGLDLATIVTSNVQNGSVSDNGAGVITFTPTVGFTGVASFDYTIDDNSGDTSNIATVTVNVNAPPVAVDDAADVDRGASVDIDVLANDTDSDGTVDPTTVVTSNLVGGTVSVNMVTGVVTFTSTDTALGAVAGFDYTIMDDKGLVSEAPATVSVTVNNALPIANNDTASVDVSSNPSVTVDVTANDTDSDGTIDDATVLITGMTNGDAVPDGNGGVVFTPDAGFVGSGIFTYTVMDNDGDVSNEAVAAVNVSDSAGGVLPTNATLSYTPAPITAETTNTTPAPGEGSYFHMEVQPGQLTHVALSSFNGIVLGTGQLGSVQSPDVDAPWQFFGNLGVDQTTSPVTILTDDGNGNVTLDFSGWDVSWNGIQSIPLGTGATVAGFTDGVAKMTCTVDCSVGDSYVIELSSTVPDGDVSGFGNVKYFLHLEGTVFGDGGGPAFGGDQDLEALPPTVDETSAIADDGVTVVTVLPGSTADSTGNTSGIGLTPEDIGFKDPVLNETDGEQCIGGCVDFVIEGISPGGYVDLVFKLNDVIPTGAVYRKLINGAWVNFDEASGDQIGSANSVNGLCQGPTGVFQVGLREDADCLFMRITDNGPNDADPTDGVIEDPSGILSAGSPNVPAGSSSGCSLSPTPVSILERADWLVIAVFLSLFGLMRFRRKI